MKFNHIGYAVKNLSQSKLCFENLGYISSAIYHDHNQQIDIILMEKNDSPIVELIYPIGNKNPLNRYLNISENAVPYHIAYSVENIHDVIDTLRKHNFVPCMKISKAVAFDNAPFIFLTNQNTGLIEILEINEIKR